MDSQIKSTVKASEDRKVPDELLQRLHHANERFHQAKQLLEKAVGETETDHQQRIDEATEQMRIAEREVEEVSLKIHGSLTSMPAINHNH